MYSNKYIFLYASALVVVVAVALTLVAVSLKPLQEENIRIEKMQNILTSINIASTPKTAGQLYTRYIHHTLTLNADMTEDSGTDAFKVDLAIELKKPDPSSRKYPVYVAALENGDTSYIFPMRGKGLWGPIWGYLSLKSDFTTVYGVMFDHKGETPGLGAEINTETFMSQFRDKQIFAPDGSFTSVKVIKGGAGDANLHGVDAISGGTITSDGLSHMIEDGLKAYMVFLKKQIDNKKAQKGDAI